MNAGLWWRRAHCAGPDRDLWTAEDVWGRLRAAHRCLEHCPVLEQCRAYADGREWSVTAVGGVVYGMHGAVVNLDPPAECHQCAPGAAVRLNRRRQQWRESQNRRRAVAS